jgi:hypothetical protein
LGTRHRADDTDDDRAARACPERTTRERRRVSVRVRGDRAAARIARDDARRGWQMVKRDKVVKLPTGPNVQPLPEEQEARK